MKGTFLKIGRKDRVTILAAAIGLVLVFLCQNLGAILFFGILSMYVSQREDIGIEQIDAFMANPDFSIIDMDSNLGLLLMIIPFFIALIALYFWIEKIHSRPFKTLITTTKHIDFRRVAFAFGIWLAFCFAMELAMMFFLDANIRWSFDAKNFLILFLIVVFVLPIQTSFEELFVRSYLMQVVSKISVYRWVPIVLSTLVFGLLHSANPEVTKYGLAPMMMYYIIAGLILAIMTIMDDRLELALGVHWATNFFGTVFVNYESSALQTYSLVNTGESNPYLVAIAWAIGGVVFLFICSKRYHWQSFNLLTQKFTDEPIA